MLISRQPPVHLTYCLNVISGESFAAQWQAVRDGNASTTPVGLGLRLGHVAAEQALRDGTADAFGVWCKSNNRYVFTINGFPYGPFHQVPVKASVYRPDWTDPARRDYTKQLADLLAAWLPDGVPGSISTVPCWYAPDYPDGPARDTAARVCVQHLLDVARHLDQIADTTGADLCLGLEPEPWCLLEHSDDVEAFFRDTLLPLAGVEHEKLLRRRIGVCIDTCHCSLAFEDPAHVVQRCRDAGIRIAKIQISAALAVTKPTRESLDRLRPFAEPVYFHQSSARRGRNIRRWPDLPDALGELSADASPCDELRVHFHVPLFWSGDSLLGSTRDAMTPAFWKLLATGICPHIEVETYTFDVLPPEISGGGMHDMIARELAWVRNQWPRVSL